MEKLKAYEKPTIESQDFNLIKMNLEIQIMELDAKIKTQELINKEKENLIKTKLNNSLSIAIIGAFIGILGAILNSSYQHYNEKDIEQQKLNSSLLIKAIETDDKIKSIENLKFLKKFNLIKTDDKILDNLISDSTNYYSIPSIYEKKLIIILDSLKIPLKNMDVYYDDIYVGKTDSLGRVKVTELTYPIKNHEIEVRENGIECHYIDYISDWKNNIQFRVKRPKKK